MMTMADVVSSACLHRLEESARAQMVKVLLMMGKRAKACDMLRELTFK